MKSNSLVNLSSFLLPKIPSSPDIFYTANPETQHIVLYSFQVINSRVHVMAEVLAIVASGAGLASLAIQLADAIDRLRKRCENLTKLRDNIGTLIEDLEIIVEQLRNLEVDHIEMLEFMVVPTALGRCHAGCENVIRRLEALIAGIPTTSSGGSKTRILKTLFKSKKWKNDFDELRSAVHGLQLNFIGWVLWGTWCFSHAD